MPRFQGYESRVGASTDLPHAPRARAVDNGLSTVGQTIGAVGDQLHDTAQRAEVSDVHMRLSKARAEWTVALQERARQTDPGDVTFADKFSKDFGEYLQKTGEGLGTRAGRDAFKRGASDLSSHFLERAGLYQSQAAGAKAKQDYLQSIDAGRNTLLADPSQFGQVMKASMDALQDPNGPYMRMSAAEREQLKRTTAGEIALSAVQGQTRVNPGATLRDLNAGKWDQYLDADKKAAALQHTDMAIRAREADAERRVSMAEREQRRAQMQVMDDVVRKFINREASAEMIRDANLSPDKKIQLVEMVRRQAREGDEIRTDPAVFLDTFQRIHLKDGDPRKLTNEDDLNALFGSGLTMANVQTLRNEVQGRRTADGAIEADLRNGLLTAAKSALTGTDPVLGLRDPKGDEQMQRFLAYYLPEYKRQREAGKTAVQLLTPDSPDYLGKAIQRYERTHAEQLRDMSARTSPRLGAASGGLGAPAAVAPANDIVTNARQSAKDKTGRDIYLTVRDGKYGWFYADGKAAQ